MEESVFICPVKGDIERLMLRQTQCIRACLEQRNVFVNLPTDFGKSLVFQCFPVVANIIHMRYHGLNVLMVISPLKSLTIFQQHEAQGKPTTICHFHRTKSNLARYYYN